MRSLGVTALFVSAFATACGGNVLGGKEAGDGVTTPDGTQTVASLYDSADRDPSLVGDWVVDQADGVGRRKNLGMQLGADGSVTTRFSGGRFVVDDENGDHCVPGGPDFIYFPGYEIANRWRSLGGGRWGLLVRYRDELEEAVLEPRPGRSTHAREFTLRSIGRRAFDHDRLLVALSPGPWTPGPPAYPCP